MLNSRAKTICEYAIENEHKLWFNCSLPLFSAVNLKSMIDFIKTHLWCLIGCLVHLFLLLIGYLQQDFSRRIRYWTQLNLIGYLEWFLCFQSFPKYRCLPLIDCSCPFLLVVSASGPWDKESENNISFLVKNVLAFAGKKLTATFQLSYSFQCKVTEVCIKSDNQHSWTNEKDLPKVIDKLHN